jgi:hypothetical protein
MNTDLTSYLVLLSLGAGAVVLDGQLIRANGRIYLQALHEDADVAYSVNRLITALFHLVMLGLTALLSTVNLPFGSPMEATITKLGVILLALAVAHAATMFALSRVYAPQERLLREELNRRVSALNQAPAATGTAEARQW